MRIVWLVLCVTFVIANRPAVAADLKVYFGLLHGHTSYSDGLGNPGEAFTMAKAAGLDFMAITEHNHKQAAGDDGVFLTPALYKKLKDFAEQHTVDGEFVAIYGQEVSTISAGNHICMFYASEICDIPHGDFKKLYESWLPDHSEVPFIQFNHPDVGKDQNPSTKPNERNNDYGIDDYGGNFKKLVAAAGSRVALIELIIGPAFSEETDKPHQQGQHESDYLFYLNQGFRLAPSAGQDNHFKTWGKATHARMGVWAEELSETGLKAAIHARRCYASEDDNASVQFTLNGKVMGSTVATPASGTMKIRVQVTDEDEPDAAYRVRLYYDEAVGGDAAQVVENQILESGDHEISFVHAGQAGSYYFVKLTQLKDEDHGVDHADDIWTAPIWIGDGAPELLTLASAENTDDPPATSIHWKDAPNYVGREVTVTGRVIRSFNFQDKIAFFNFDRDYENTLTMIVMGSDFDEFEGGIAGLQEKLNNKVVRAKGKISLYQNERLQLRLSNSAQIVGVADDE